MYRYVGGELMYRYVCIRCNQEYYTSKEVGEVIKGGEFVCHSCSFPKFYYIKQKPKHVELSKSLEDFRKKVMELDKLIKETKEEWDKIFDLKESSNDNKDKKNKNS